MLERLFTKEIYVKNRIGRTRDGSILYEEKGRKGTFREIDKSSIDLEAFLSGIDAEHVFIIKGVDGIEDDALITYDDKVFTIKKKQRLSNISGRFEGYRIVV